MKKVMFVCSCNLNRSVTFENEAKKQFKNLDIRSAGIYHGYPHRVTPETMKWADKVYVMDLAHLKFIHSRYPECKNKTELIGVSDQYDVDSPELKDLYKWWVANIKQGDI